jgi:uncharacterized repeat protein (TIGR01451 family)
MLALVLAGLAAVAPRAGAQGFGLSVTTTATSLLVSNSVTYNVSVTNLTALPLTDAVVTNLLPDSVVPLSATNSRGYATNYGSVVVFDLGQFPDGGIAQLSLTVEPTAAGFITNTVTVTSITVTNTAVTNVVVQVTNAAATLADLGVSIVGPVQAVITNDWMTYGVVATNFGPDDATGVALTNALPPGVILRGAAPADYTVAGSNLIFNLGALAAGGGTNFQFTLQATNAGALALAASIGSDVLDTNTANNFAASNVVVGGYLPGQLVAFTNSAQSTNFLAGLLEQSITVSNAGTLPVAAARVVVAGLTNRLFNAAGTNGVNPFVVYDAPAGAPLAGRQCVNLLLQYFPRKAFPFTNGQLQAFAVSVPNLTPPAAVVTGTNVHLTRIVRLSDGNMLLEWPAISNRTYTVVYADNVLFSNALMAPPSITAPANDVEWIDYGPPTTVSAPATATNRFYRVFLNP